MHGFKNVHLIGLGAIGAKYAAMLHDYDANLLKVIVNENRKQVYEAQGFVVNSKHYDFNYVSSATESGKADLILVAVKSTQLTQALIDIKPYLSEHTIVLSLLNGINTYQVIGESIGFNKMLYSVIYMDAVRQGNVVNYHSKGRFVFGERNNNVLSQRVLRVAQLFDSANIVHEIPEDMELALWRKYLINIIVNQLSFIIRSGYQLFKDNEYVLNMVQLIGEETVAVANAYDVDLNQIDIEALKQTMLKIDGAAFPSMYQDRVAGRYSEVEIFSGELLKLAKDKGISVPYNTIIYHLIKAIEFEELERG